MDELDLMEMDVRHALNTENANAVADSCGKGLSRRATNKLLREAEHCKKLYCNACKLPAHTEQRGLAILAFEQASKDLELLIFQLEQDERYRLMRIKLWRDAKRVVQAHVGLAVSQLTRFWG